MPSTKLKCDSEKPSNKLKQSRISFLADKKDVTPTLIKSTNNESSTSSDNSENSTFRKVNKVIRSPIIVVKDDIRPGSNKNVNPNLKLKKIIPTSSGNGTTSKSKPSNNKSMPIQLSDDSDDEDVPLSMLKKKMLPTKKPSLTPTKVIFPPKLDPQNFKAVNVNSSIISIPANKIITTKMTAAKIQSYLPNLKGKTMNNQGHVNISQPRPAASFQTHQVKKNFVGFFLSGCAWFSKKFLYKFTFKYFYFNLGITKSWKYEANKSKPPTSVSITILW